MRRSVLGRKFNRLTVIAEYSKNGRVYRHCLCDCGKYVDTTLDKLESGHTKSCGCIKKGINSKHGFSDTRLYRIYRKMLRRCYVPEEPAYKYYGAKGIKICDEWLKDRSAFLKWSIENGYSDRLTIDRINVYGNYEPNNCRWATKKEQALNRSNNVIYEYNGVKQTEIEWAAEYGINRTTLSNRIKRGWSVEKALTEPIKENKRNKLAKRISTGRGD